MGHIWGVKEGRCYFKAGSDMSLKMILWLLPCEGGTDCLERLLSTVWWAHTAQQGDAAPAVSRLGDLCSGNPFLFQINWYSILLPSSAPRWLMTRWKSPGWSRHLISGSHPVTPPAQRYPRSFCVHTIAPICQVDVVNLKRGSTQGFQGIRIAVQLLQSLLVILGPGKTFYVRETG